MVDTWNPVCRNCRRRLHGVAFTLEEREGRKRHMLEDRIRCRDCDLTFNRTQVTWILEMCNIAKFP